MWNELANYVPNDHAGQVTAEWMVKRIKDKLPTNPIIVDVGCGAGNSVELFRNIFPGCRWIGIDIQDSPEVSKRTRSDATFMDFDGVNIPLESNSVDLVFSRQALEHVRYPELLFKEMARILKLGSYIAGSTSHLEPYHSFQYWNFTPFGFKEIAFDAGAPLVEIRPGIDGMTLIQRTYEGRPKSYGKYFESESPTNKEIDLWANNTNRSTKQTLMRKLTVCGHFSFLCQKQK